MDSTIHKEKTQSRSYRYFSVPATDTVTRNRKLDFFYVGKRPDRVSLLVKLFESGYAAENTDQAQVMMRRLLSSSNNLPDIIIVEASLGYLNLLAFSQFVASQKKLAGIPLIMEGSSLTAAELQKFRAEPLTDDIIDLAEFSRSRLTSKVCFWKNVKQRITEAQQPAKDDFATTVPSASDFLKRGFDIVTSLALLIALSPLFLLIMIGLKIESRGPVFYISKRAGKGYRIFDFYKFRTMDAEANAKIDCFSHLNLYNPLKVDGPMFIKIDNDPRVTRLGALLRKYSLDELPQLVNVLKGDMSLVGNRPLPLYEAATLTTDEWAQRFMAPAGMTGLWQIKRNSQKKMSAEERIRLDINYASKSNFLYDLWIMANTPGAVIQHTNA